MGEVEQLLLTQADERALEHRRQGQVVLWQQQELAQGDQVHDRQLLAQDHAVDTGHRHASVLQRAHQLFDEGGRAGAPGP